MIKLHNRSEYPDINKRILAISPCYPKEHDMRARVIDAQFLNICSEVEYWIYIDDIERLIDNEDKS